MSGFLDAKIAQFLPKNLTNRMTISSIFKQKLNSFIYREIPPDLIRVSLKVCRSILIIYLLGNQNIGGLA